jgi:hypothetical protein
VNHKAQGSNWSEGCNAPSAIGLKESKSVKPIDSYINLNPVEINKNKQHIPNLQFLKIIQKGARKKIIQLSDLGKCLRT